MAKMNQFTVKLDTDEMWIILDALDGCAESYEEYAEEFEDKDVAKRAKQMRRLREKLFHTKNDTK